MSITLEQAHQELPKIIEQLSPGEELVITQNSQVIARLRAEPRSPMTIRRAGNCQGMMRIVEDDEDHLADFKEYM
ncbi:MAG: hypothetical protein U0796_11985 [Gemmatales bacterium]